MNQDPGVVNCFPDILAMNRYTIGGGFPRIIEKYSPDKDVFFALIEVAPFSEADKGSTIPNAWGKEKNEDYANPECHHSLNCRGLN